MFKQSNSVFISNLVGAPKEVVGIRNPGEQGESKKCKYCGSTKVVRYGYYGDIPRSWCKECRRKFADNKAAPGWKTPQYLVSLALSMYYEGTSLKTIRNYLRQRHNSYPISAQLPCLIHGWPFDTSGYNNKDIPDSCARKHHRVVWSHKSTFF